MKQSRRALVLSVLVAAIVCVNVARADAQACNPGIGAHYALHAATYNVLIAALAPQVGTLQTQMNAVVDQATYATLLSTAHTIKGTVPNGRVLLALPDGTVMIDTSRPDDPTNVLAVGNSFAHFQAKTVNENHNSRVAIFDAQEWPCGGGIERKFSSSTGFTETYLAIRLGAHLNSVGTARLSTR
jgi:hypothetical protein